VAETDYFAFPKSIAFDHGDALEIAGLL